MLILTRDHVVVNMEMSNWRPDNECYDVGFSRSKACFVLWSIFVYECFWIYDFPKIKLISINKGIDRLFPVFLGSGVNFIQGLKEGVSVAQHGANLFDLYYLYFQATKMVNLSKEISHYPVSTKW